MAIIASSSGKREAIPEGVYLAICTRVIDLGDQMNKQYNKIRRQVLLSWEIPEYTIEVNGAQMPCMVSKDFTLSLAERSALRGFLESWRGKAFTEKELAGFDLVNILNTACQLQIIHSETGYERINSIMALPRGVPKPTTATELIYFDLTDTNSIEILDKLPEWIKDKVKISPQYQELVENKTDHSDIPDSRTETAFYSELPFENTPKTNVTTKVNANHTTSSPTDGAAFVCADCNTGISQAEYNFSSNKYGRPLCRKCQTKAKQQG